MSPLIKYSGWKLSAATAPDSTQFEIKDGSLILHNQQRSAGMVTLKMPFYGELNRDAGWMLQVKLRHLQGSNNFNYGVCLGAKPGTVFTDGLFLGLAANQNFKLRFAETT